MNDLQKKIKDRIQAAQRVLITSHVRPDGDAIGSSLALALALLDAGKQVQVVLSDGIPTNFKQLPGAEMVRTKADGEFDLIVSVDCSDLKRIGDALDGYHAPDIIIDHHVTTEAFRNPEPGRTGSGCYCLGADSPHARVGAGHYTAHRC